MRADRAFCLSTRTETTAYHWDGATLHRGAAVRVPVSHYAIDVENDRWIVAHYSTLSIYRGVFSGDLQLERSFSIPIKGMMGLSSVQTHEAQLYFATTGDPFVYALDIERAESEPIAIEPASTFTAPTSILHIDGDRLCALEAREGVQQWRIFDFATGEKKAPSLAQTTAIQHGFAIDSCRPSIAKSDRVLIAVTNAYGGHSHFVTLTTFDRRSLQRLFSIECPMLYTREAGPDPDPFYVHCDAVDELILLCESARGIGLFRSETFQSLAEQRNERSALTPSLLHARAERWLSKPGYTIEAAFLLGVAEIIAVWRDNQSRAATVERHEIVVR